MVFCKTDCGWKGKLGSVREHETNNCEYTEIPCPNNCEIMIMRKDLQLHCEVNCLRRISTCLKCENKMEQRDLDNHTTTVCTKRDYTCPLCNEAGVYDERTTTHLTVCPKVEVQCSKCLIKLFRANQYSHTVVNCPNEPVRCKYCNIGCEEKHEKNIQLHLDLATDKVLKLTSIIILKNTMTFRVTGFAQKKVLSDCIYSPHFSTSEKGYKMRVRVDANGEGDTVSVLAFLMKGDHDDTLTWPFTGSVTIELLNQLEDKNHHKKTAIFLADSESGQRVVDSENGTVNGIPTFISHDDLDYDASANSQYLKDDTLVFRVSAEAPDHKPWLECIN